MKRIVFLCDEYAPKPSPNGICVRMVANELKKQGFSVGVVALENLCAQEKIETIDGIDVHRINPGFVLRNLMKTDGKPDIKSNLRRKIALKILWASSILYAYKYPLMSKAQVRNYLICVERMHQKEKIDVLICCYHKIAAVSAGIKFKKKHKECGLAVYSLDAMSGGIVNRVMHSKKIPINALKRWEKRIFNNAEYLFAMSAHEKYYSQKEYEFARTKIKYLDIPFMRTDRLTTKEYGQPIKFVYTGSVSKAVADPTLFFEFIEANPNLNCTIDIYGGVSQNYLDMIKESDVLSQKVKLYGCVPHEEIMRIQANADILLQFANDNHYMVHSKIFEYMATGRKILSFTPTLDDASVSYLRRYPNAEIIVQSDNFHENSNKIRNFLYAPEKNITAEYLEKEFEKNFPKHFVKTIEDLFVNNKE